MDEKIKLIHLYESTGMMTWTMDHGPMPMRNCWTVVPSERTIWKDTIDIFSQFTPLWNTKTDLFEIMPRYLTLEEQYKFLKSLAKQYEHVQLKVVITEIVNSCNWLKGAGEAPMVTRPAIAYRASLTYMGLNAFLIIPHSQLGPRFADLLLYPLALFAKKSSWLGDRKL